MTVDRALVQRIRRELRAAGDPVRAGQQQAYMKSSLPYHGVAAPDLSRVLRPLLGGWSRDRPGWEATLRAPGGRRAGRSPRGGDPGGAGLGERRRPLAAAYGGQAQLRHRSNTDVTLLAGAIEANLDDRSFWLRKAIGWALREHARTDPEWVRARVGAWGDRLAPLLRREALKHPWPAR